ncbi:appetite-regulating hormone isoform X4 [Mustela erminea]|uniref:appetite-regulating hormone isoform X4 n=1 Tax=Mustela erminea TaxID=36723 RepID=UPI0013873180|nr:appetite-regulating hormone isoform X4 [Mustela erminea]
MSLTYSDCGPFTGPSKPRGLPDTMPSLGTLCSLLLFSVLWMDLALAGSSFLSPEHQKVQFNTPFDVGIKLSGAQYHQHGQALGKFLQDILWEEANEALEDK